MNNQPPADPPITPEELAKIKEQINKSWEESVQKELENYKADYDGKEFTFTKEERELVGKLELIAHDQVQIATQAQKSAQLSELAINDVINTIILPRLKVSETEGVLVSYSSAAGRFVVWKPKVEKKKKVSEKTPESK